MRAHYEFSTMKARKNPYVRLLKQAVTIRIDRNTVAYFKDLAASTGIPYQSLINLYLRDCALRQRKPSLKWKDSTRPASPKPETRNPKPRHGGNPS